MKNDKREAEFTPEELEEIRQWAEQEEAAGDTPAEYHFTNPDPYAKCEPVPEERRNHNFWFGEDGHIHVKNLSAYWIPELTVTEEIAGTVYTVTGSYEGTETLDRKLRRIMARNMEDSL